jgi:hypothetical protein
MKIPAGADWGGRLQERFRLFHFRMEWGRYYFKTNECGDTIWSKWAWEED